MPKRKKNYKAIKKTKGLEIQGQFYYTIKEAKETVVLS